MQSHTPPALDLTDKQELLDALKELARAYRIRVPAIFSTDGVWDPLFRAEDAIRKAEGPVCTYCSRPASFFESDGINLCDACWQRERCEP